MSVGSHARYARSGAGQHTHLETILTPSNVNATTLGKKAILHRKNSLFYKTLNGTEVGDLYMGLIHTCDLCGTNPVCVAFEF